MNENIDKALQAMSLENVVYHAKIVEILFKEKECYELSWKVFKSKPSEDVQFDMPRKGRLYDI